MGTTNQPRVVGSNGIGVLTASDDLLFRCLSALLSWEHGRMWFFVNESSVTPPLAIVVQHGPPPSQRQGILSRLCSHTGYFWRDAHVSPNATWLNQGVTRASGLAPVFMSLICSRWRRQIKRRTTTRLAVGHLCSCYLPLPLLSIYNVRLAVPRWNVIGHAIPSIFSPALRSNCLDAL